MIRRFEETRLLKDRQRSGRSQMSAEIVNELELDANTQHTSSNYCEYSGLAISR